MPSASLLLDWYDRHRRDLPWRARPGEAPDPYRVWLSEIMLQQTSVGSVIPYFHRFVAAFPTVAVLAAAPVEDVLREWAGLGYYARARNLHRAAAILAADGFPRDITGLRALPGVGDYTAAAIGAIAFAVPGVAIDGNVERLAARLFAIEAPLPAARPVLHAAARRLGEPAAARARPADFVQALFDLGAGLCTRAPACALCPWRGTCLGHHLGIAADLPARTARAARPVRHGVVFVLWGADGTVLLRRRPPAGLLGGMPELPGTAWEDVLPEASPPVPGRWRACGAVRHVFTHFELRLTVYAAQGEATPAGCFRALPEAAGLPTAMHKAVILCRDLAGDEERHVRKTRKEECSF